jgi:aspergillopepsin I
MPQNLQKNHRIYNVKSGTEVKNHTWQVNYQDKSTVHGKVFRDKVTIGSLTVPNQAVEAAAMISSRWTHDTAADGILGLAFVSFTLRDLLGGTIQI